ncbi:MAG: cytochrome c biogenesis protein CcdA [Candidatus Omnitrophica bacterium]|nr:cytochrome c biogenesis protein CcdA [Candidatus Omnitrophota bacterium]
MQTTEQISYVVSFTAGFLMFFSPCILPLVPSYLSYLTGVSFQELSGEAELSEKKRIRLLTLVHALLFIAGFSIVFILLGLTVTVLGKALFEYQVILKRLGAILIIFFGLVISGVLKVGILTNEKRIAYKKTGVTLIGSILVGATFALAWTPCAGPVLGSILVYASTTANLRLGFELLSLFSLGLAIPFFLAAVLMNSFLLYFKKIKAHLKKVNILAGAILIIFGLIILIGG